MLNRLVWRKKSERNSCKVEKITCQVRLMCIRNVIYSRVYLFKSPSYTRAYLHFTVAV